ncbi:unnamed protein product [Phaedon cochleariae]|uniref:BESS domain-containing protein n=1 Tax=Phaedon cochleariae TaxID=80249 RepID=A0A9N9X5W0_PHACE|nr:unnamed protein product [Phaedon cochleariae]
MEDGVCTQSGTGKLTARLPVKLKSNLATHGNRPVELQPGSSESMRVYTCLHTIAKFVAFAGAQAETTSSYVADEELTQLDDSDTIDSAPDTPASIQSSSTSTTQASTSTSRVSGSKVPSKGAKRRGIDDFESRLLNYLETPVSQPHLNEDQSFLNSLLPTMARFDDEQKLEFRLGVLQLIKQIKHKNDPVSRHTTWTSQQYVSQVQQFPVPPQHQMQHLPAAQIQPQYNYHLQSQTQPHPQDSNSQCESPFDISYTRRSSGFTFTYLSEEETRMRAVSALEIDKRKRKRHEEKVALKREMFESFEKNAEKREDENRR